MHDNLNRAIKLYNNEELPKKAVRDKLEAIATDITDLIKKESNLLDDMDKSVDSIRSIVNDIKERKGWK